MFLKAFFAASSVSQSVSMSCQQFLKTQLKWPSSYLAEHVKKYDCAKEAVFVVVVVVVITLQI